MIEKEEHNIESKLTAYINGELSAAERAEVDQWIHSSEANRKQFEELEKTWILSGQINPKPVAVNPDAAWDKVREKITAKAHSDQTKSTSQPKETPIFKLSTFVKIAASVVVLLGAVMIIKLMTQTSDTTVLTAKNDVIIDTLIDGSVVSLNKNSSLSFSDDFGETERRVNLSGEAFFEITPDANKPFVIDLAHDGVVKVLGTSFNVQESDSTTEVFVKTGKVSFTSATDEIVLTPGQKGIMNHLTGEIKLADEKSTDYNEIYWLDQHLLFEGTTLNEVTRILSIIFEKTIELQNPEIGRCELSTEFERESLEQILQVISETFNLEIEKTNTGYLLKGNGC